MPPQLQAELRIAQISLLNDLEANAYGIQHAACPRNCSRSIRKCEPRQVGNRALISAGTGLGEAGLLWDGVSHRPFASEGGHASFAPNRQHRRRAAHLAPQKARPRQLGARALRHGHEKSLRLLPRTFRRGRARLARRGTEGRRSRRGGEPRPASRARTRYASMRSIVSPVITARKRAISR